MTSGFGQHDWIWVVAFAAILLIAYRFYRRIRRLVGRQRIQERRLWLRAGIIGVAAVAVAISLALRPNAATLLGAAGTGLVVGAVIGIVSLRLTEMGRDERGMWYVPNLYLGIGLIALLIARLVYDYAVIMPQVRHQLAQSAAPGAAPAAVAASPMSEAILFLVIGYYVLYYGGILVRARRMPAAAPPATAGSDGQ